MRSLSSLTKRITVSLVMVAPFLAVVLLLTATSLMGTLAQSKHPVDDPFPPPYYYYVNTFEDQPTDIPAYTCHVSPYTCSLRAAVKGASADLSNISRIFLPAGTYTLTYGSLTPDLHMEIIGEGADTTIIHVPLGAFNIMTTAPHAHLTLYDLTLTGGIAPNGGAIENYGEVNLVRCVVAYNDGIVGGGIWNNGTLTLTDSLVTQNSGAESDGGIYNLGTTTLVRTTVSHNDGGVGAGGIANIGTLEIYSSTISLNFGGDGSGIKNSGELTLKASTLASNESFNDGGAIFSESGLVKIINSTISGNSAENGAGIYNSSGSTLWMTSTTIANNTASNDGGGLYMQNGAGLLLRNSILSGNTAGSEGGNCHGPLGTPLYTLVSSNDCYLPDSVIVADPLLGDLQNNGGPTATHALPEASPARNAVSASECTDFYGQPLLTDQRGRPRFAGWPCDMGAFEFSFNQFLSQLTR